MSGISPSILESSGGKNISAMFTKLKKYIYSHKLEIFLLLAILLIASFFRLYRIADYMTFLGDEGRDAIVAKDILRGNFTLLGPRASAGDFFLGPIYYYMMAPFLLLSNYDPVGPAIMVALIGVATVGLIYIVGKDLFNTKAGLIAAGLYAIAPLVISYSRSSWNPNPMPFFALLILYLLYKGLKSRSFKTFLLTGFLLGLAMQLHYLTTFLGVIVFFFVVVGEYMMSKKSLIKRYLSDISAMLVGFLIGLSPFLLFEIRHGFPNIRTIFKFILEDNTSKGYTVGQSFVGNVLDVSFRLFARLTTAFPPPEQVNISESINLQIWQIATIILATISVVAFFVIKDRIKVLLLALWLVFGILLFGIYRKPIYDYYLGFMFPLPFLLIGNLLSRFMTFKKQTIIGTVISVLVLSILVIVNLSGNPFRYPPNKQKDQAKRIADFVLLKAEDKPFNFALLTRGNSDHVYRYFFETSDRTPVVILNSDVDPLRQSVTEQLLVVCEYQECQPLGNPLWEVAGFGRAQIEGVWDVPFVKIYKLRHLEELVAKKIESENLRVK